MQKVLNPNVCFKCLHYSICESAGNVNIVIEIKKINVMKFEYFIIVFLLFLRKNPKQRGKIIASQAPA